MKTTQRMPLFLTLVTTCVGLSLLSTALHTALPSLIADFDVSLSVGQWATSGYALTLAATTPLTAFLSMRFPTRPLYLVALGCFLAGIAASALAPTFAVFMAGRVLQAAANALIANITQVSIMNLFPAHRQGRAMGWFGLATGAAPIAAPALGGIVVDIWGWRMVFWLVGALCLADFISALFFMRNILDTAPRSFDGISFCLSLIAFGGVTLGLGNVVSLGFSHALSWAPLAMGVCAALPFVARQLRAERPFLKVQILQVRDFRWATMASALLYAAMMGATAVLPLYVQGTLGYSAAISGFVVLPGACATALASPIAGRFLDRFGVRALAFAAGLTMAIACAILCIPMFAQNIAAIAVANTIRCAAVGFMTMPFMTWGNASVPNQDMPHASALLTSMRNLSGALGIVVFAGLLDAYGFCVCCAALAAVSASIVALSVKMR